MKSDSPLCDVFDKLQKLGLPEAYVRARALPSWWNDSIAETTLGRMQAIGFLSVLGVDSESLFRSNVSSARFAPRDVLWKMPQGVTHSDLEVVKGLCSQAAQLCAWAMPDPIASLPTSPLEWRERLLARESEVNFKAWLDECWNCGVAVLSATSDSLPQKATKPHGMAAHFDRKSVIVLTGSSSHTAWQLFRGLHETGHVARGHLSDEQILVDRDLRKNLDDPREREADAFATQVLYGKELEIRSADDEWMNAQKLASESSLLSARLQVEPGALLLNWAKTMRAEVSEQNCWATAQKALRAFPSPDAHAMIRRKLEESLDWEQLSENQAAFVRGLCGLSQSRGAEALVA